MIHIFTSTNPICNLLNQYWRMLKKKKEERTFPSRTRNRYISKHYNHTTFTLEFRWLSEERL